MFSASRARISALRLPQTPLSKSGTAQNDWPRLDSSGAISKDLQAVTLGAGAVGD